MVIQQCLVGCLYHMPGSLKIELVRITDIQVKHLFPSFGGLLCKDDDITDSVTDILRTISGLNYGIASHYFTPSRRDSTGVLKLVIKGT